MDELNLRQVDESAPSEHGDTCMCECGDSFCPFPSLRAGYMLTVLDTSDPEWWQGKCLGKVGFFPSKYVTKLFPGERPLQVIHTVQVNDGDFAIKLMREQVSTTQWAP